MAATQRTLILAQDSPKHYTPAQRDAVKHWAVLTGGLILGGMLLLGALLVLWDRQRRALVRARKRRRGSRARPSAWVEAGKRLDPSTADNDGSRDDTVDLDPGDLGPHDVDGDDPRDPHGEGPHG